MIWKKTAFYICVWLHMHLEVVIFREQKWILEANNQCVLGYPAMGLTAV